MATLTEETSITLTGFPRQRPPKFIVAELPETPALTQLRGDQRSSQTVGHGCQHKPFRPHISLARLKPKHTPRNREVRPNNQSV